MHEQRKIENEMKKFDRRNEPEKNNWNEKLKCFRKNGKTLKKNKPKNQHGLRNE